MIWDRGKKCRAHSPSGPSAVRLENGPYIIQIQLDFKENILGYRPNI